MKKLSIILLYSRPIVIVCLLLLCLSPGNNNMLVVGLIAFALLADVFDGIIARKLNISTTSFRVLDTVFDLMFYLSVLFYSFRVNPTTIFQNQSLLLTIFILEAILYAISLVRFGRLPSPHAFLSKCWGLWLVIEFILIIMQVSGHHFAIALSFGLVVHLERVLIYALLPNWDHDIPSAYHAWQLRQGKTIKRHPLLNG